MLLSHDAMEINHAPNPNDIIWENVSIPKSQVHSVRVLVSLYVCTYVCMSVSLYSCMAVILFVCESVCMYVYLYVSHSASMLVCMSVCTSLLIRSTYFHSHVLFSTSFSLWHTFFSFCNIPPPFLLYSTTPLLSHCCHIATAYVGQDEELHHQHLPGSWVVVLVHPCHFCQSVQLPR